jgi:hypothetical protein
LILLLLALLGREESYLTVSSSLLKYIIRKTSLSVTFTELATFINPRTKLVDEVIARVQRYHIIRVRGTPASGKTTVMQLVANKLLEKYGQTTPIHTLSGWNKNAVEEATGWNAYLKQETGVRGDRWPTYPAYLLLDEAQQSRWDSQLWADLFKAIQPVVGSPFVILFSSYGTPNSGFAGFDEEYFKIPMVFAAGQQIALRSDESIDDRLPIRVVSSESAERHTRRPVGLLLDEDETIDVVTRYASAAMHPSPSLSEDLKKGFFQFSEGHAGLLTSLLFALSRVPVSVPLRSTVQTQRSLTLTLTFSIIGSLCPYATKYLA